MARRDTILVTRTLYQIGVVTVIGALSWVGVSVYHALVQPPEVEVNQNVLAPINPVIDQAVIDSLTARLSVVQDTTQNATISGDGAK